MSRKSKLQKKRRKRLSEQSQGRADVLDLLRNSEMSIRNISSTTSVPETTVGELREMLPKQDEEGLSRKVRGVNQKRRTTILTVEKEKMVTKR